MPGRPSGSEFSLATPFLGDTSCACPSREFLCLRLQRGRNLAADVLGTGSDDARTLFEVERSGAERLLDVEQVDREAQLAAEELRRGDVDRARRLERADGVDTTGGEMAERKGERAHDPQPVGEVGDLRRVPGDERRSRRLEGEDLDLLLRPHRAERLTIQGGALSATRRALLAGAEVVDEAEDDVVHRLAFGDRDREGEERDAALGVERAVDGIDDDQRQPRAADPADLLGDDRAGSLADAGEYDLLRGPVDRRRVVSAEP